MAQKEEKVVKEKNKENKVKKHFFKDFKAELKKVIWPTPKQLGNNTIAVVVIVVVTAALVFALDATFEAINKHGITNLQSFVVDQFGEEKKDGTSEGENQSEGTTSNETSTDGENGTESNQ